MWWLKRNSDGGKCFICQYTYKYEAENLDLADYYSCFCQYCRPFVVQIFEQSPRNFIITNKVKNEINVHSNIQRMNDNILLTNNFNNLSLTSSSCPK